MKYSLTTPTALTALALIGAGLSTPAFSDIVQEDDVIISGAALNPGRLCVGAFCADGETFPSSTFDGVIKMSANNNIIQFNDASTSSFPDRDWAIQINETIGSTEAFFITDETQGTNPFWISGGAGSNSLFISSGGNVGLGTSLPSASLHIVNQTLPAGLRLESAGLGGDWDVNTGAVGFFFSDRGTGNAVLRLENGAPDGALAVKANGNVGLGLSDPEGILHTKGDGVQLAYFESGTGGPVQVRFRTDSENRRFLAVNNANEVKSQIIFLDDRINFTGQTDSGANLWLSIGPDGITSQGPTCGSPCDLTFDPDVFEVPPIEVRAEYMWENMHLPAIGPTSPHEPINLTEKTGGIIHELEVAHIYIEQLHDKIERLEADKARQEAINAEFAARFEALEAE